MNNAGSSTNAPAPLSEDIRVGGLSIEGLGMPRGDSNRGSEADIKEAIHKVM